eukprot:jgi/Ulvmu1/9366/UM050_0118.1
MASRPPHGKSPLQKARTSKAASPDPASNSVYSFGSSSRSHDDHTYIAHPPFNTPTVATSPSPNYLTPLGTIPATALPLRSPASQTSSSIAREPSTATPPALNIPQPSPSHNTSPLRLGTGMSQELSTPSSLPLPACSARRHFTTTAETMTHVTNPVFSPPRSVQHARSLPPPLPSPRSLPSHAILQQLPSTAPASPPLPGGPWRTPSEAHADEEGAALDAMTSTGKDGSIELDFSQSPVPSMTPKAPHGSPALSAAEPGRLSIPVVAPVTVPAPREELAGRFLIRRFVGATPFAQVFAANDLEAGSVPCSVRLPAPGAPAAAALVELGRLQWLRNAVAAPDGAGAFARVLSMPALLGHGALVAMEHLEESTAARLRRIQDGSTRPFSAWDLKCIARQLLQGAAHMHANGIVHGDLSPHSVFFKATDGTQLRVVDVGCGAFPVAATAAAAPAAAPGSMMAEVQKAQAAAAAARDSCAAPEAAATPPTVSDKGDVYAIGCTLFYLATGRHLHRRKEKAEDVTPRTNTTAGPLAPASPAQSSLLHSPTVATSPGSLDSGTPHSVAARLARGPLSLSSTPYDAVHAPTLLGASRGVPRGPASEGGLHSRSTAARILQCHDAWAGADPWQAAALLHSHSSAEAAPGGRTSSGRGLALPQPLGEGRLRSLGSCSIGSDTPLHPAPDAGPVARGWAGVIARASLRRPRGLRRERSGTDSHSLDGVTSEVAASEPQPILHEHPPARASHADDRMQQRLRRLAATPIAYLLRDLLWDDPAARPTAQEALQHPFFYGTHSM